MRLPTTYRCRDRAARPEIANFRRIPFLRRFLTEQLEHRYLLASVTVDTLVDEADGSVTDGDISLRDAIKLSESGDTITFGESLGRGTIHLALGQMSIRHELQIDASALVGGITIDARGLSRIFNIDSGTVDTNAGVSLAGLTLTGGRSDVGGAIRTLEPLRLRSVNIVGNEAFSRGGGIFTNADAELTIIDSAIVANVSGTNGGGIYANAPATILNSTVSGNKSANGGAAFALTSLDFVASTITKNLGTAIAVTRDAYLGLENSIVSANDLDLGRIPDRQIGSLVGLGDAIGLAPLADNGGPTLSHALLPGSPAIDRGVPSNNGASVHDQRGFPFVRTSGVRRDIGAFEAQELLSVTIDDVSSPTVNAVDELVIRFNARVSGFDISDLRLTRNDGPNLLSSDTEIVTLDSTVFYLYGLAELTRTPGLYTLEVTTLAGDVSDLSGRMLGFGTSREWVMGRSTLGITVDTATDESDGRIDDGDVSLRDAILNAATGETIKFAPHLDGATIVLSLGEIALKRSVTIDAADLAHGITIDASGNDPTPTSRRGDGTRIFNIDDGNANVDGSFSLRGLTLTGADSSGRGGAVRTQEQLTVTSSYLTGNSGLSGGGIYASRALTVMNSTIAGNSTVGSGGGIRALANVNITNATVSQNGASQRGGGISALGGAAVVISQATITGNSGAAGGGGIDTEFVNELSITNSIVAANVGSASDLRVTATRVEAYYSLIGDGTDIGLIEAQTADPQGNVVGGTHHGIVSPLLGPLTNNGGPLPTHALQFGSRAINGGASQFLPDTLVYDQRGGPFLRSAGSRVDMGAYEAQSVISDFGVVWEDADADGVKDLGEYPVPNVVVQLLDGMGKIVAATKTDGTGRYLFTNVDEDDRYSIRFVAPVGTHFSPADSVEDDTLDSDVDPRTGMSPPTAFAEIHQIDAGLVGSGVTVRVGGVAWADRNGTGIRNQLAELQPGVQVTLLDGNFNNLATAITASDGTYEFSNLASGWYSLQVTPPPSVIVVPSDRGNDDLHDSDFSRVTRRTEMFFLISGQSYLSQDVGLYSGELTGTISDSLRISEIMSSQNILDYIEFTNIGSSPIQLDELYFVEGIEFHFAESRYQHLFPGEYLVVVASLEAFSARYDVSDILIAGEYRGGLDNSGKRLTLSSGLVVEFDGQWFAITDELDFSLTLRSKAIATNAMGMRSAWRPSTYAGGSPGYDDPRQLPQPGAIVINEVMTNPSDGYNDWIELKNTTDEDIDISYWYLADDDGGDRKYNTYQIPSGTVVPAGGMLVFTRRDDFQFGLSSFGEFIQLTAGNQLGQLMGYSESIQLGHSFSNVTFGQYGGEYVGLDYPTSGSENVGPKISPVMINEIMYKPGFLRDEFIELYNNSDQPIDARRLRVADGVSFDHFPGISIQPRGYLLVVPIDPAAFRIKYDIAEDVAIVGPYTGVLNNNGDDLRLYWADGQGRSVQIDHVAYDDDLPWPEEADQGGGSLERVFTNKYGNNVSNWEFTGVFGGTPGARNFRTREPGDFDDNGVLDAADIDMLSNVVRLRTNDLAFDITNDFRVDQLDRIAWVTKLKGIDFGDANMSGTVDATDFGLWSAKRFLRRTGWASGDFNGDGMTDVTDFNIWNQNRFSDSVAPSSTPHRNTPRAPLDRTIAHAVDLVFEMMAIE